MRAELREICEIEITRLSARQKEAELSHDDVTKLQKLISSLKTLEDSNAPENDQLGKTLNLMTPDDLFRLIDELD